MKKTLLNVCFIMGAISLFSCGNNTTNNKQDSVDSANALNESDTSHVTDKTTSDFVTKAASGGMLEVQAGQLAAQKGVNPRVKDFGLMMVRDHSKSNDELKAIAKQKGIALPQTLSDDNQKHLDELKKQNGKDFDKAYMDLMQSDHKGDIDEFKDASEKVTDPDISRFAKNNVPVLQMHLDSVNAIKESLKK